jgi:ribonuclease HIII
MDILPQISWIFGTIQTQKYNELPKKIQALENLRCLSHDEL